MNGLARSAVLGQLPAHCYGGRLNERGNDLDRTSVPWLVLIVICVGVFVVSAARCAGESSSPWWEMGWGMDCPAALRSVGAAELVRLWEDGGWWRVATTGLVHGSALHLALNMWSLWVIGPWASRAWGHGWAFACFAVTSVAGVLASVGWAEAPVVVGASAGILGLAGGLWVSRGWGSAAVRDRVHLVSTRGLGITLALMVGLGFAVPMIAQAGHLGGLGAGLAMGAALSGAGGQVTRWACWVGTCVGLLVLGWAATGPQWRANYYAFRGFAALEEGETQEALPLLRTALDREPGDAVLLNAVAYALAEAGVELQEAEALVDQALKQEPDNADYLDTKGWVLCRRGRVERGLEFVERASEASGGSVEEIEEHREACATAPSRPAGT